MVPVDFLDFRFPGVANVRCAFTTRRGGASLPPYDGANLSFDEGDDPVAVAANRRNLAERLGLARWSELRQMHRDALVIEPASTPLLEASRVEADAQATSMRGLALVIKTADCQSVLLAHESGRFVAALHVGWRGNVLNLPGSAVTRLCAHYGCEPSEFFAVRGPSLGPTQAQFTNFEAEFGPAFLPFFDPATQNVDLWRLTRHQLQTAGLLPSRIFEFSICTKSTPASFFSFRITHKVGRMMGLIWIDLM